MALLCDYIVKNWSVYALHHLFCEKSAKTVISSILYVEKSVYRHTRFSEMIYLLAKILGGDNQPLSGCCGVDRSQNQV